MFAWLLFQQLLAMGGGSGTSVTINNPITDWMSDIKRTVDFNTDVQRTVDVTSGIERTIDFESNMS